MITRTICGLAVLLGFGAAVSSAAARECGPLKMLASVKLIPQPAYLQAVPVTINGMPKQLVLDTGGIFTQVNPDAARSLHLSAALGASPIFNASGTASGAFAKIDSFEFGGMTTKDVYLRISPSDLGADGLFSPDLMKQNDVEMDFAGGKMNYFLSDHCPGKVVYWPHGDVAQVSLVLADKRWIKVPVTLDGKPLLAVIDTGAASTMITTKTAQDAFGLTLNSPGMEPAGNVNGDPNLASYYHSFSGLTLDGITIKNPRILVMPDRVSETNAPKYRYYLSGGALYSQKRIEMPDLILGMDVLKHLHLYFAFEEHNLYATIAEVPVLPPGLTNAPTGPLVKRPQLSPAVGAVLREAQAAFRKRDFPAALAAASKADVLPNPTPFDVFVIRRFFLSIHAAMKDMDAALKDAEAAADTDASVIPDLDKGIVYKAALELSFKMQHYDKAVGYARLYQATNPPESDQALIKAALSHAADDAKPGH